MESWPEAKDLPDFGKIIFDHSDGISLKELLPFASSTEISFLEQILK